MLIISYQHENKLTNSYEWLLGHCSSTTKCLRNKLLEKLECTNTESLETNWYEWIWNDINQSRDWNN